MLKLGSINRSPIAHPPAGGGRASEMYSIYALYNKKHDKIYIGQTKDLGKRQRLHLEKKFRGSYTARFDGDWILIYTEQVLDRSEALKREKQLKSFKGREFIKTYIPR